MRILCASVEYTKHGGEWGDILRNGSMSSSNMEVDLDSPISVVKEFQCKFVTFVTETESSRRQLRSERSE